MVMQLYIGVGDDWFDHGFKNLVVDKSIVTVKLLL